MDSREFSTRVEDMQSSLYRVAYGIMLNQADSADAVQEALLRAWEKRASLREKRYFGTWLTRILINVCRSMLRKKRPAPIKPDAPPVGADIDLHDAIAALDEKLRLPLVLHYMEGFSVQDVAAMTHWPEGTVKTRLRRARLELKASLSDHDEGRKR